MSIHSFWLWVSILLTDEAFATDKWFWQILSYILGLQISMFYFIVICGGPIILYDQWEPQYILRERRKVPIHYKIISYLWFFINFGFFFYCLIFVIDYIRNFKKIRDIVLMSLGAIAFTSLIIYRIIKDRINE